MKTIGFIIFPDLQQLDMTAPYEVFASAPDTKIELIAKNLNPIKTVTGLYFTPTTTFKTCGDLDVLCVPGGRGVTNIMEDDETIKFIQQKAQEVEYLTSICTGSLVLGVAGLLKNKAATCHWSALDLIAYFGGYPKKERVVFDGNLVTAGGVTSGIDFGLTLIARLYDENTAKKIQLFLQYSPMPPFHSGTPEEAPQDIYKICVEQSSDIFKQRLKIAQNWQRLNLNK